MRITLSVIALAGLCAAQVPSDPPPFLQITRVPSGSKAARPYKAASAAIDVIGLTSVTGLPETWFIEPHLTFGSMETLDRALQAAAPQPPANQYGEAQDEYLGAPRTMIAQYVPRDGYRPGETIRALPKSRYFRISVFRAPGADVNGATSARRAMYDRANLDRPDVVYAIISGAPSGTTLVLAPLPSLSSIDEAMQRLPEYAEPFAGARDLENLLFRVDPRLSYVSADFAGQDAAFWQPQRQ